MPFTFSHPSAILPAKWLPEKWVSITALIIGSITPDFEYFIRMKNLGLYGHTLGGLFWFDLPIGFALTFIYHSLVRDSLIDNLPRFLRSRLNKFKGFDWNTYVKQHFLVVIICLLIGIATHLLWDSFTHRTGYFVQRIPWLEENTEILDVQHVRFYILQNISSLLGMLLVIIAVLRIPKTETVKKKSIFKYWAVAVFVTVAITTLRTVFLYTYKPIDEIVVLNFSSAIPAVTIPEDIIMTGISAALLSLIITPFIIRRKA